VLLATSNVGLFSKQNASIPYKITTVILADATEKIFKMLLSFMPMKYWIIWRKIIVEKPNI